MLSPVRPIHEYEHELKNHADFPDNMCGFVQA